MWKRAKNTESEFDKRWLNMTRNVVNTASELYFEDHLPLAYDVDLGDPLEVLWPINRNFPEGVVTDYGQFHVQVNCLIAKRGAVYQAVSRSTGKGGKPAL